VFSAADLFYAETEVSVTDTDFSEILKFGKPFPETMHNKAELMHKFPKKYRQSK